MQITADQLIKKIQSKCEFAAAGDDCPCEWCLALPLAITALWDLEDEQRLSKGKAS